MANFAPIINSFTKGQLTPWMKGRTDTEPFFKGAEILENVLIRPFGGALRTPGTEFIAETKDSTKTSVLIPFVFSITQTYMIEAGDLYFRFYIDGGRLEVASVPVETVSPYSDSEVEAIQFAQSQDVSYLVHPDFKTRKLSRTAPTTFVLTEEVFFGGPFLDDNITATTITSTGTTGSVTLTSSAPIFTANHVGALWKMASTVGSPPVQGYLRITGFTSTTEVSADVVEILSSAAATDEWAEGAWSDERGFPRSIVFHESRLWYGGTAFQPNKVWGSKSFLFDDFTPGSNDDDSVSRELPTRQLNSILWLSSEVLLVAGTSAGEFTLGAGSINEAMTPSNIVARSRTVEGSEPILPVRLRNRTFYVQRSGRKLLEFYYIFEFDNYDSKNPTLFSEYITGTGIRRMALQQNEDNIIWCVLNDGDIATMTREIDQQVASWTLQTTDGDYESVGSIPRENQRFDDVYVIVNRTINSVTKRYVEVFKNPRPFDELNNLDNRSRMFYLHSALKYDAYQNTANDSIGLTLSAVSGVGVTATASAPYFVSSDVGNRIREVNSNGDTVGEATITAFTSTTIVTVDVNPERFFGSTSVSAGLWGKSVKDISGLGHLEAKTMGVLGDGSALDDAVVSSGAATLSSNHFIIISGLKYLPVVKTFPLEGGGNFGTSQGRFKRINKFVIRVYKTLGLTLNNGEKDRDIFPLPTDLVLGDPIPLFTGDRRDFYEDTTRTDGQISLKQFDPLPMNIIAISYFVETYDK